MGFRQALGIGAAQALALIPGISRSGVTMGGGLLAGLSNEDAARYAFLLATPMIGAAGAAEAARALRLDRDGVRGQALVGAIAAAITTWAAVSSSSATSRRTASARSASTASAPGFSA